VFVAKGRPKREQDKPNLSGNRTEMWGSDLCSASFRDQKLLESSASEGESPVWEAEKVDSRYPEYRWSDIQRECGGQ